MKRLGHLWQLSGREPLVLFGSLPLLVLVRLALWLVPFRVLHRWWSKTLPGLMRPAREPRLPPARISWLVSVASRLVPRAHCLTRAVVAQYFLARAGFATQMHIGVRKDGARLDAHAWLEHDGVPLFEDRDHLGQFTRFEDVIATPPPLADGAK